MKVICIMFYLLELSHEKKEQILDYTEKYSMIKLYKFLFCMTLTDEDEDLGIQKRYITVTYITFSNKNI